MHRMKEIMEKLEECAKSELDKGTQHIDAEEMSKVLGMIENCAETLYYYSIYEAMKKAEKEEEEEKRYYGGRRRDSRGRFMKMGYEPMYDMIPGDYLRDMDQMDGRMYYTEMPIWGEDMRRGYQQGSGSDRSNSNSSSSMGGSNRSGSSRQSRYGYSHDEYMKKREQYSQLEPDQNHKRVELLDEYMDDLMDMAKEVVSDMSVEEKQVWKTKLNKIINM